MQINNRMNTLLPPVGSTDNYEIPRKEYLKSFENRAKGIFHPGSWCIDR
jgi:hypothetical protein